MGDHTKSQHYFSIHSLLTYFIILYSLFGPYCRCWRPPALSFNCKEVGAPDGGISKHPYPNYCQYFVYCVKQVPFVSACPPLTYFNEATSECDFLENVNSCSNSISNPNEDQEWTVLPTNPSGEKVNDCSMRISSRYPLKYGDCGKYVDCIHGKAIRKECHLNQLFDVDTNECQDPERTRCWHPDPPPGDGDGSGDGAGDNNNNNDLIDYVDDTGAVPEDKEPTTQHVEGPFKAGSVIQAEMYYVDGVFYKIDQSEAAGGKPFKGHASEREGAPKLHMFTAQDAEIFLDKYGRRRFEAKTEIEWMPHPVRDHEEDGGSATFTSIIMKNDGEWTLPEECPKGKYVNGLSVLRRAKMAKGVLDNVGVISLSFQCFSPHDFGRPIASEDPPDVPLEPPPRDYISWVAPDAPHTDSRYPQYYECENGSFAVGFQLNQDPDHGAFDDMATANVRLLCSFGEHAVKPYWLADYQETSRVEGEWTDEIYCKPRQAACGGTMQMMKYIDKVNLTVHDNTGLNSVKVRCCDVRNPARECVPIEKEVKVAYCNNIRSGHARPCEFNATIGTAYDYWRFEYLIYFYESVGFTRENQIDVLSERFTNEFGQNGAYRWNNASRIVWMHDQQTERRIYIPGGWETELFQVIAECGHYIIHTNRFFRIDSDVANGKFTMQYFDLL